MRKELQALINNPKGAHNIDELKQRVEDWDTNCRLMIENGGVLPSDETMRLAYVEMLPPDLNTNVSMKLDEPEFATFTTLKKYVDRYVKLLQWQRRNKKTGCGTVHLVDRRDGDAEGNDLPAEGEDDGEDYIQVQAEVLACMRSQGVDQDTKAAVWAIVKGRFQRRTFDNNRNRQSGQQQNGNRWNRPIGQQAPPRPGIRLPDENASHQTESLSKMNVVDLLSLLCRAFRFGCLNHWDNSVH